MLLDDPIAMYLDEGGKISPGFRLRNPQVIQEVPEPEIGVPDIPLVGQADTSVPSRNRNIFRNSQVDVTRGEVDSVRETLQEQPQQDPITGSTTNTTNVNTILNDPINGNQDMNAYTHDPIWGSGANVGSNLNMEYGNGYGGAFTTYDDAIPGLEVGPISFGNTEYIGA